jgi:LmbE family N-acetylglucosaminyl deacetylase
MITRIASRQSFLPFAGMSRSAPGSRLGYVSGRYATRVDHGDPITMRRPLRLMAVLAHPDDESLGLGGTLAKYAAEGVETYLVTATRGERGRYLGERFGEGRRHPGPHALGALREAELRAAADVLGLLDVQFLDYEDATLDQADPVEATARIADHLRRVRPDVVITFGPEGAYGHPDHVAICQLTTAAIHTATSDPRDDGIHRVSKLYYLAWGRDLWDAYNRAFSEPSSTVDGVKRLANPWPDWAITTRVDAARHWETAWAAIACHRSQIGSYAHLTKLEPEDHETLWGAQSFYRALSLVNGGRALEDDLFQGLR